MTRSIFSGGATSGAAENLSKTSGREILGARGSLLGAEQTFRRHDDERLDEVALHLTAQDVKILRRRREVADLDVILRTGLEEALEPRAGVFRSLAFVAMRQEQARFRSAAAISIPPKR